jgi:hypothetical protein
MADLRAAVRHALAVKRNPAASSKSAPGVRMVTASGRASPRPRRGGSPAAPRWRAGRAGAALHARRHQRDALDPARRCVLRGRTQLDRRAGERAGGGSSRSSAPTTQTALVARTTVTGTSLELGVLLPARRAPDRHQHVRLGEVRRRAAARHVVRHARKRGAIRSRPSPACAADVDLVAVRSPRSARSSGCIRITRRAPASARGSGRPGRRWSCCTGRASGW